MLILEGLYLGDVRPSERSFRRSSLYALILAFSCELWYTADK